MKKAVSAYSSVVVVAVVDRAIHRAQDAVVASSPRAVMETEASSLSSVPSVPLNSFQVVEYRLLFRPYRVRDDVPPKETYLLLHPEDLVDHHPIDR